MLLVAILSLTNQLQCALNHALFLLHHVDEKDNSYLSSSQYSHQVKYSFQTFPIRIAGTTSHTLATELTLTFVQFFVFVILQLVVMILRLEYEADLQL